MSSPPIAAMSLVELAAAVRAGHVTYDAVAVEYRHRERMGLDPDTGRAPEPASASAAVVPQLAHLLDWKSEKNAAEGNDRYAEWDRRSADLARAYAAKLEPDALPSVEQLANEGAL